MSVELALKYLLDRKYAISSEDAKVIGTSIKQISGEYNPVRQELWASVYDAVWGFMNSKSQTGTYASPVATAIAKAYISTSDIAYLDGGGSLPLDEDTLALAKSYMNAQLGYVDSLFETLKQLRKEGDFDAISIAFQKANQWSDSLDGFYNIIKLKGAGNKMLTFTKMRNTKESCDDCKKLRGQRHRASWWISHEYVPPKGANLACSAGGHCGDALVDDSGNEFTI